MSQVSTVVLTVLLKVGVPPDFQPQKVMSISHLQVNYMDRCTSVNEGRSMEAFDGPDSTVSGC